MTPRRRHADLYPSEPRIDIASSTVVNRCKWVARNGYAHCALVALGWTVLMLEPDGVLMQAPASLGDDE